MVLQLCTCICESSVSVETASYFDLWTALYKLELRVDSGEMGFLLSTGKVKTGPLLKTTLVLILFFIPVDELV